MSPTSKSGNPAKRAAAAKASTQVLDLDARRAAVREAEGEGLTIRFGGRDFVGPVELPVTFAYAMTQMDVETAARALFGDDGPTFLALNPSIPDLEAIVVAYGVELGEASASPPFSIPTGQR